MILTSARALRIIAADIGVRVVLFTGIAVVLAAAGGWQPRAADSVSPLGLPLIGATLGIFLAFKTNAAYDRWWEARTLWGGIVNASRSLARQVAAFAPALVRPDGTPWTEAERAALVRETVHAQIGIVHAMGHHLRGRDAAASVAPFVPDAAALAGEQNVPAALLHRLGARLGAVWGASPGGAYYATALDQTLTDLTALLGGCERIKDTPLPRQYEYFPRLLVNGYCFLEPFTTVHELGSFTPVATFVLSVILLGLDDIGARIGYPFAGGASDTPVTALATAIEINLRQGLGETALPEPVRPVDGVLS